MKFLKVVYDLSNNKSSYFCIDGKEYAVCGGLRVRAIRDESGNITVDAFNSELKDASNSAGKRKKTKTSYTLKQGESASGVYSVVEWDYILGCYNYHVVYEISVLDSETVLSECEDPVIKARIYMQLKNYEKVDELLKGLIEPNKNHYYFVNLQANEIQAKRYELGLGVKKDLRKAYVHYLYACSYENVVRFMDMGYGKGVLKGNYKTLSWNECYTCKLLYAEGEQEYAYYRVKWLAGCWFYSDEEKKSKVKSLVRERKLYALCRRQACEWIMERRDEELVKNDKFELYLGAYLSYLKNGSEDCCTKVVDNGGGSVANEVSPFVARIYIKEALNEGNKFAVKCAKFVSEVKGVKQ